MNGVDISHYQDGLNIANLPNDGYKFAILKLSEGHTIADPCFDKFYAACQQYKIPAGAYVFSYATTEAAAIAEANYALSLLKGRRLDLGIYMDVETTDQMSCARGQLDKAVRAFCKTVEDAGYKSGIYGSEYNLWRRVDPESFGDSFIWVAHYGKQPEIPCDIWQSSDNGSVSGFKGAVDVDVARSARFKEIIYYEAPKPAPAQRIDGAVATIQYVMHQDGYWGEVTGKKSKEFFAKLREFTSDMEGL